MRLPPMLPLLIAVAATVGCGDADSPAPAPSGSADATYARSLDRYCSGLKRAQGRTDRAMRAASTLSRSEPARAFDAVKTTQIAYLRALDRQSRTLARASPPDDLEGFHETLRDARPAFSRTIATAQRRIRKATDIEELQEVDLLVPTTAPKEDFPRTVLQREPSCRATSGSGTANPRAADAAAQHSARDAALQLRSCSADGQTFKSCASAPALTAIGFSIADDRRPKPGEIAITGTSATDHRILAPSRSGNRFAITVRGATITLSCSVGGRSPAGCMNGQW